MKREYRLRNHERIEQVRGEGRCWTDRLMVMCILPNELASSRFGFSVSRRIGKAVVRNQARRRMREAVRLRRAEIAAGWDVVFIARPPIAQAGYQHIEQAIDRLLYQAGLSGANPALAPQAGRDNLI